MRTSTQTLLLLLLALPSAASAQTCANPGPGWSFCDDFESLADRTGELGLWDDQGVHPQNLVITTAASGVHSGQRALQITAHKGRDTGGGPTKWVAGADTLHARFFVKFDVGFGELHHFVSMAATRASDRYSAFGMAGCRPSGANFFISGLEPTTQYGQHAAPGAWNFYTYSQNMSCNPGAQCQSYADPAAICSQCAARGSPCSSGPECCWGNSFMPASKPIPQTGQWYCMELRITANSAGQANGSQALWIDGVQLADFGGIRWRTDDTLKVNALALFSYVTDGVYGAGQTEKTVWFDDVVISTSYIGCATGATSSGTDAGSPCTRSCGGKQCGPDGCGATCGSCASGSACDASGRCTSGQPECTPKTCAEALGCGLINDGCGGQLTCAPCDGQSAPADPHSRPPPGSSEVRGTMGCGTPGPLLLRLALLVALARRRGRR